MVSGVDEAGRGPVIGPLVIAGVSIDENDLPKLADLGVKDSKLLSPQRRETLAAQIKELSFNRHIVSLSPHEIDRVVERGRRLHKLNRLEAQAMARVITVLTPDVVYVDAADILADRFGEHIAENLSFSPKIVCEHKADASYPIVSAASIIAKVERDRAISQLQKKHGNMGCGYPSDPNTIKFLEDWIRKFGDYPDFVRKSWKTAKRVKSKADARQRKLQ
ncbi:MAG TPA: ribonuclease HII [Candidatus Bathyarchaeota archaeon]|nr:ribonuclease HII [Candidatus Bathyarchaeota archaeon]